MDAELARALAAIHPDLGVHTVFFTVPTPHVAYVMSVLESYESVGVTRSHDPAFADGRVLMVAMVVPDFADVARAVLAELHAAVDLAFVPATTERIADLRAVLGRPEADAQRRRKT